jgi:hypothetical protein
MLTNEKLVYVPAKEIWPNAKNHTYEGVKPGLVGGFCIEVMLKDGSTDWLSCEYVHGDPITEFNDDFHRWYYNEHQWTPTGRISFRGYGIERYDPSERDTYIEMVS